jgi:hypothetical protein
MNIKTKLTLTFEVDPDNIINLKSNDIEKVSSQTTRIILKKFSIEQAP